MATEERVLCFQRNLFEKIGVFQGISLEVEKYLPILTAGANVTYINRSEAEQDRSHKQLIPYALIICGDKILRYRRGKGGQETRLHGLFSVGVGGHISEEDHGLFSKDVGYHDAMRRELQEEVEIEVTKETAVAVINDDSTEVGYVHLGIVHIVQVADETIANRRSGLVGAEFISMSEAVKNLDAYESWSRFCLENLDALQAKAAAIAPDSKVA
jgi:predicted NUDIX family phosphoesterase